jgi:adhesin/invasin
MKKISIILFALLFTSNTIASDLDLPTKIKKKLTSDVSSYLNNTLGDMFPTAEVSLSSGNSNQVTGSILVVKPLNILTDSSDILFTQGSLFLTGDKRQTINLGFGHRRLLNEDTLMIGYNVFYDHELDYDHQRASVGIEAITSVGALRANQYYALSSSQMGLNNQLESALDGNDIELGVPLPYLPWANFYLRSFEWKGEDGASDLQGDEMSLEAKFSDFNIEVGKRSNDGGVSDSEFINFTWTCCNNKTKVQRTEKAYNLTSVADQKYTKVKRQNRIVKQSPMSFSVIGF